jgi:hypothetical protein
MIQASLLPHLALEPQLQELLLCSPSQLPLRSDKHLPTLLLQQLQELQRWVRH